MQRHDRAAAGGGAPLRGTRAAGSTAFQAAVAAAFLRVMRARRPDLLWAIRETGKAGERLAEPDERDALADRPTGAA